MTTYNKYFDTYIKAKTTGAISGGYALRVDGNSNLNGNVNIPGTLTTNNLNISTLATCPTVMPSDNSTNIATTAFIKAQGYLTASSLSPYALISSLSNYVLSSDLTAILSNYVLSSNLTTYITSSSLTTILLNYITSASLTSILSSYITDIYLTDTLNDFSRISDANELYQTKTDMTNYSSTSQMLTTLNSYLTINDASMTYQPQAEMIDFLSKYEASTLYQTLAGMSSYITSSNLTSTLSNYVLTSSLSSYITSSSLSSTLSSYAKLSSQNIFTNTNTFNDICKFVDIVLYNGTFNSTISWINGGFTSIGSITCKASTSSMCFNVYTLINGFQFTGGPVSTDSYINSVQPYTQLIGAGTNNGYTTSASNEIWGKNNNAGATGYFIVNTYAGYTQSNTSGWNSSQGYYYAPYNGIYTINLNIFTTSDYLGNKYLLSHYNSSGSLIYSNLINTASSTTTTDKQIPYSTILKMNQGDYFYVSLSVRNGSASWWFGNSPLYSSMTITKIS